MQVSTALACGRVIAEGIAMLPWKVYQAQGRTRQPEPSHPIYDKLATVPNPLQSAFEFQETIGLHLAFCGQAVIWTPTVRGTIDALWPMQPGWVTVKYRWPEPPSYEVRVGDGRPTITLSAAEVWHIRGPSWDSYAGIEFLDIARQALGLAMAIEEGQAKLQAQGVKMPGFLSTDSTLTDEQHKQLEAWIKKASGAENAGMGQILDRGMKWIETAMTNVDAQTLEQRKLQVEEVCRFMRVLPIMIGHADKTATYASAEQMFLAHSMYTSGPWARRLEQSADRKLLTADERAAGFYTNLNEKALLRMSAKDQMEYLSRGVLTGILTRNEGREKLDLNPIEGLDIPLAPANTFTTNPPSGEDTDKPPKAGATD